MESLGNRYAPLAKILVCPITRMPLRLVGAEELREILAPGQAIPEAALGAFVSDAAARSYPIVGRVANLLERDSLRILSNTPGALGVTTPDESTKWSVKEWYDKFGWKKNEQGNYNDSALFSQSRPEGHGLYELQSHLSIIDRLAGGEWVIDAASGAVAHPEYLAYSWSYRHRVCVDMSSTALEEAAAKLRGSDYCVLADICRLPFRDDSFEGGVSGYTVQHIPESQQAAAVSELFRVLMPGAHLCVMTDIPATRRHRALWAAMRAMIKVFRAARIVRPPPPAASAGSVTKPPHELYFFPRPLKWWLEVARSLGADCRLESLRIFSKYEFDRLFGTSNRAAKLLRALETFFPRFTAGMSAYCLIDVHKPLRPAGAAAIKRT